MYGFYQRFEVKGKRQSAISNRRCKLPAKLHRRWSIRCRSRIASRTWPVYAPELYMAVCEMPRNSTPSSSSALSNGARKWSAQFACSLPGGAVTPRNLSRFWRHAATFPWRSHARWFLDQMARWDLIAAGIDRAALAARVYRPDLYRAALTPLGISVPVADTKPEGAHDAAWTLDAAPRPIAMGPDRFCDGLVFEARGTAAAQ